MATAFLYDDGSFVFSSGDTADSSKTLVASYTGWDTAKYGGRSSVPWYIDGNYTSIVSVSFDGTVTPLSTAYWFHSCSNMTSFDQTGLNTSNVTTMCSMFYKCTSLTVLDLGSFDTSKVTNMGFIFSGCKVLTILNISSFNTSEVTDMTCVFQSCEKLTTLDISNFNTSNVTDMSNMFNVCKALTTIYVSELWDTNSVTNSTAMFSSCKSLIGGNGTVHDSSIVDATYARIDTAETPGYFTNIVDHPDNIDMLIKFFTMRDMANKIRVLSAKNDSMNPIQMSEVLAGILDAKEVSF